jgi:hypothetical protein
MMCPAATSAWLILLLNHSQRLSLRLAGRSLSQVIVTERNVGCLSCIATSSGTDS